MEWSTKIHFLQRLLSDVGKLWTGTKLSGYAESGPYHCQDCEYLRGRKEGSIFRDAKGKGRCSQEVMMADSEVKKDSDGYPIVNIEKGCCEFVDNEGLVRLSL